jgi:hypothetical protein
MPILAELAGVSAEVPQDIDGIFMTTNRSATHPTDWSYGNTTGRSA